MPALSKRQQMKHKIQTCSGSRGTCASVSSHRVCQCMCVPVYLYASVCVCQCVCVSSWLSQMSNRGAKLKAHTQFNSPIDNQYGEPRRLLIKPSKLPCCLATYKPFPSPSLSLYPSATLCHTVLAKSIARKRCQKVLKDA